MSRANPNLTLAAGMALVVATIAAYLYAAQHRIDFGPILAIVGPVIAALFLQNGMTRIERKTDQAVENTNGALTGPLAELASEVSQIRSQLARGRYTVEHFTDLGHTVELDETPPSTPPSPTV